MGIAPVLDRISPDACAGPPPAGPGAKRDEPSKWYPHNEQSARAFHTVRSPLEIARTSYTRPSRDGPRGIRAGDHRPNHRHCNPVSRFG